MKNKPIKKATKRRGIKHLYHFTQQDNLKSILRHGIVSRKRLQKSKQIDARINDKERLDGLFNTISCSIEGINESLFYVFRKRTRTNWVIIELKASILWKEKCAYCATNAANNRVRRLPKNYLLSKRAFKYMFAESSYGVSRKKLKRSKNEPTDAQAEVLVFGRIDPSYITRVYLEDAKAKKKLRKRYPDIKFSSLREALI